MKIIVCKIIKFLAPVIIGLIVLILLTNSNKDGLTLVEKYCDERKLDKRFLTGPENINVGNVQKSQSWTYNDGKIKLELLVNYDYFYGSELSIWDYARKD
jgi:hypothetical protein